METDTTKAIKPIRNYLVNPFDYLYYTKDPVKLLNYCHICRTNQNTTYLDLPSIYRKIDDLLIYNRAKHPSILMVYDEMMECINQYPEQKDKDIIKFRYNHYITIFILQINVTCIQESWAVPITDGYKNGYEPIPPIMS